MADNFVPGGLDIQSRQRYWRQKLDRELPVLDFPVDYARPPASSFLRGSESLSLNDGQCRHLQALCNRENLSEGTVLLAALGVILWRYTGQQEIVVGAALPGSEGCVRLVPLFVDVKGDKEPADFLRETARGVSEAAANGDIPFYELVSLAGGDRDLYRAPLFQVLYISHASALYNRAVEEQAARCDLVFVRGELDAGIELRCLYDSELFGAATIRGVLEHYACLLDGFTSACHKRLFDLPLMSDEERERVVRTWNRSEAAYPDQSLHRIFESQARSTPEAVALICGTQRISYAELNKRANRLAHLLQLRGVVAESRVGICLQRSIDLVVAIIAVLKAGGVYVPLDSEYPVERLRLMTSDAKVVLVITRGYFREHFTFFNSEHVLVLEEVQHALSVAGEGNCDEEVRPDSLAYVVYTSGSTGTPKGVAIRHRGIVRLVIGADYLPFGADHRVLFLAPTSFDASALELWGALLHGATSVISPTSLPDWDELENLLKQHQISWVFLTTTLFNTIIDERPQALETVAHLLIGGEALSVTHIRRALELLPHTRLINGYGPTECTVFACAYPIPGQLRSNMRSIPIGRPIANTQAYVLDEAMHPVAVVMQGELYLGGDGVAEGYLEHPELTAHRFVPDPFSEKPEARLYRTGDRARWLHEGCLEYMGRMDRQVKIRGYRIEPGEIEETLRTHGQVSQAVVVAHESELKGRYLVAHIVPKKGDAPTSHNLRSFLAARMPAYMVPLVYTFSERLSLLPTGKIDYTALTAPNPFESEIHHAAPRNETECALAEIWSSVLGLEKVGIDENFLLLGGNSLTALRVTNRIRNLGYEVTVSDLLAGSTIEGLAKLLARRSP